MVISIHAAREGGDHLGRRRGSLRKISIHAAREGGDNTVRRLTPAFFAFQSTPPVKAATLLFGLCMHERFISIHAAREGGDLALNLQANALDYFNPRRP